MTDVPVDNVDKKAKRGKRFRSKALEDMNAYAMALADKYRENWFDGTQVDSIVPLLPSDLQSGFIQSGFRADWDGTVATPRSASVPGGTSASPPALARPAPRASPPVAPAEPLSKHGRCIRLEPEE